MAQSGLNTELAVQSGSVYAPFTGVMSITVPSQESDTIDVTHLGSTAKEFITGLPDPGTLESEILYDDAVYEQLDALRGVAHSYKITLPDNLTATFTAILTKTELDAKPGDALIIKCSFKVTGAVTLA